MFEFYLSKTQADTSHQCSSVQDVQFEVLVLFLLTQADLFGDCPLCVRYTHPLYSMHSTSFYFQVFPSPPRQYNFKLHRLNSYIDLQTSRLVSIKTKLKLQTAHCVHYYIDGLCLTKVELKHQN